MAFFIRMARQVPRTAYGAAQVFGCAYPYFGPRAEPVNGLHAVLFDLMKEVGRDLGLRGRHHTDAGAIRDGRLKTISEVAAILGRHPESVYLVARELGVLEPHLGMQGTPHLIARRHVDPIGETMRLTMPRTEAARYLGLLPEAFDQVVRAGLVGKFEARWSETGHKVDMYDRRELDRFLDSIPTGHDPRHIHAEGALAHPLSDMVPVSDAIAYTVYDAGEFFGEVLAGRLTIDARTSLDHGLNSFWLAPADQPWDHPFTARCYSLQVTRTTPRYEDGMSMRQVCAVLEVSPDTVASLLDHGHIHRLDIGDGTRRHSFDKESIAAFAARYIAGKLYAGVLGCTANRVTGHMARYGVKPLIELTIRDVKRYSSVYDRAEMRAALGLTLDPDQADVTRACWKAMANRMAEGGSLFTLSLIRGPFEASFCTNDAGWPMRVVYDFDREAPGHDHRAGLAYTIEVAFEITGSKAAKRIDALAATLDRRELHPLVHASVDRASCTCRASTLVHVVDSAARAEAPEQVFARRAVEDAPIVNRMMNLLKASLEEGPRRYDARMFGSRSAVHYS